MTQVKVRVGIIGGSGLDNPEILDDREEKFVDTPYGKPSDALIFGTIKGVDCILLARHGRKHALMPSSINYCANIWALKNEGCTHVIVTTACGSLKEEMEPGHIVFPDQFIDRTTKRNSTFYDGEHLSLMGVCHMPMHEPFCEMTRKLLIESASELGITSHSTATVVTIEGPRFSSRAESKMFQNWGGEVINMTSVPEVCLAKEAAMCYASIAMVTDYDCWKDDGKEVNVSNVMETFGKTVGSTLKILIHVIPKIAEVDWTDEINKLKVVVKQSNMMSYMH